MRARERRVGEDKAEGRRGYAENWRKGEERERARVKGDSREGERRA